MATEYSNNTIHNFAMQRTHAIAIGVAVALIIALIVLLRPKKPKPTPGPTPPEPQQFEELKCDRTCNWPFAQRRFIVQTQGGTEIKRTPAECVPSLTPCTFNVPLPMNTPFMLTTLARGSSSQFLSTKGKYPDIPNFIPVTEQNKSQFLWIISSTPDGANRLRPATDPSKALTASQGLLVLVPDHAPDPALDVIFTGDTLKLGQYYIKSAEKPTDFFGSYMLAKGDDASFQWYVVAT